jgi:membrane protein YdbS with pleckstrin-like domain
MEEKKIWNGSPSQWMGIKSYIVWLIIPISMSILSIFFLTDIIYISYFVYAYLFIGLFKSFWIFLNIRFNKIKVSNQRLIEENGIFSKITNELELFRVKDIVFEQPFLMRLVGLSIITLITSDKTSPQVSLTGIKGGKSLKEDLRKIVEIERERKKVYERDFE